MWDSNKDSKAVSTWDEALCLKEGPSSAFLVILRDLLLLASMFSKISPLLSVLGLKQVCFSWKTWHQEHDLAVPDYHSFSLRPTLMEDFTRISADTCSDPHCLKQSGRKSRKYKAWWEGRDVQGS